MKNIYLDYASTTPMDLEVRAVMEPYFSDKFGNPGAVHKWGQEAQAAVDGARNKVAGFLGCNFDEIVFTGSATESNNLAIRGIIKHAARGSDPPLGVRPPSARLKPHIITSAIEHKSVLETCKDLEKDGVEVTYLPVTKDGLVRPEDAAKAIKENTALVSIGYVNSEIGTNQPISEIANVIRNFRNAKSQTPFFHTDAVQAMNYLDCNVGKLGVDMLTFSGHKIYGPKGIGVLYVKKGTQLSSILTGGNQERGARSGTENVPFIVGLGKAVELVKERREKEAARMHKLRDYFIDGVLRKISGAELNGSKSERIANNANFLFRGVESQNLLIALDQEGIGASSGSTCTIKTPLPSHVVSAIGRSDEEANQSIRFTLGRDTTEEDIDSAISVLRKIVEDRPRQS